MSKPKHGDPMWDVLGLLVVSALLNPALYNNASGHVLSEIVRAASFALGYAHRYDTYREQQSPKKPHAKRRQGR